MANQKIPQAINKIILAYFQGAAKFNLHCARKYAALFVKRIVQGNSILFKFYLFLIFNIIFIFNM